MITKSQMRQKLTNKQLRKQAAMQKMASCALTILKARALEKEAAALNQSFLNTWNMVRQG